MTQGLEWVMCGQILHRIIANEDKINFFHKLQKLPYKCNMAWLLQQQVFQEKNANIKPKFLLCIIL